MKILSFGEVLWDVYPDNQFIGGAPMNFAAHFAKHGDDVYMLSAVGKDALGEDSLNQLNQWGLSTKYVSVLEHKQTGKCLVTLDENSVPSYNLLQDVAYDYISCENITDEFDVLYFGTLALRSEYNFNSLQKLLANKQFGDVFVDVNIRPPFYNERSVRFSLQNATVVKISQEELAVVQQMLGMEPCEDYQAFARDLAAAYPNLRCIIITLGGDGAYALDCVNQKAFSCGSEKVTVVSTVGAGDSFSSAFMHHYLQKRDLQFCLEYASKVAGFVVTQYGAVPDYAMENFL